ncbi:MAG: universal stress protein [Gammaproteobacteria bacterium]|jgi:universal stress protein E|nr:universal stress protein [Gammaproteobacteria bacterium]
MSRNILCIVEFDKYPKHVVARATWLAKSHNCNLHLLVSDPVTDHLGDSYVYLLESQDFAEGIRASQGEAIAEMITFVEEAGVRVEVDRSGERHVADLVRREADARQPTYVIKGTHYHTPSERASLGSVDWDLIRDLDYPLWFVKPVDWKDPSVIVAAVDPVHANDKPAHLDMRIIERACTIADNSKSTLLVVHTYQTLDEIGSQATWAVKPRRLPVEELNEKIRTEHDQAMKLLAEMCRLPEGTVHMLPGRPEEILPAFADKEGASLVVMGALARSKFKQRIVGSTAARALDHFNCDVLVAHAKPKP